MCQPNQIIAIGRDAQIALGVLHAEESSLDSQMVTICDTLAQTRPTAVNLFWAIDRMKRAFAAAAEAGESVAQIKDRLDREAALIHDEDVASCRAMGAFGAAVVPDNARILRPS